MKPFIIKLTVISLTIALAGWLTFSLLIPEYYLPVLPWLLLFFYVVNIVTHAFQVNLAKKDMAKFARSNMLFSFFKLVLYSAGAVAYIAFDKANALTFVICLMLLYIVFTFTEVRELTRIHRGRKK